MGAYQEDGCDSCNTFPYLEATGMCAGCTFGEYQAQVDMLNGEYDGTVWEREKVNDVCPFKIDNRDSAIDTLNAMGVDFKECNNGMQLNIKSHKGLVMYWPTTRMCKYKGFSGKLLLLGYGQFGNGDDISTLITKMGFDKKSEVAQ